MNKIAVIINLCDVDYLIALVGLDLTEMQMSREEADAANRVGDAIHLAMAEQQAFDLLKRLESWRDQMKARIEAEKVGKLDDAEIS
jgi:hypothetical protein